MFDVTYLYKKKNIYSIIIFNKNTHDALYTVSKRFQCLPSYYNILFSITIRIFFYACPIFQLYNNTYIILCEMSV